MKEVFLVTKDKIKIALNHYENDRDVVIIIAHGWYMCKDAKPFLDISKEFFKSYDVITMDFRGHGKSSGWFTFTSKEPNDLKTVVEYAKQRYNKVCLIGFSLGAALSIIHAACEKDISCLITVSAPCDFYKIENHCWRPEAFIPTIKKIRLDENRNVRPGNIFLKKIKPIDIIQSIAPTPILFLAGEKDPTVYPWHTEELYNKADAPKKLEIFKNNYHSEDLFIQSKDKFIGCCTSWLNSFINDLNS